MPRRCTICAHPERAAIDQALVRRSPYRDIALRFHVTAMAAFRHREDHLPAALAQAEDAAATVAATDLLAELRALRAKAVSLLLAAERQGDYRTALAGIREARGCLELLAELQGELDRRPAVNLIMSPEWLTVRAAIFAALVDEPIARARVAARLVALEAG